MLETPIGIWFVGYGLVTSIIMGALYLLTRTLRKLGAWANRDEGPRERAGFYLTVVALLGFVAGGFLYKPISVVKACNMSHQPTTQCFITEMVKRPEMVRRQ